MLSTPDDLTIYCNTAILYACRDVTSDTTNRTNSWKSEEQFGCQVLLWFPSPSNDQVPGSMNDCSNLLKPVAAALIKDGTFNRASVNVQANRFPQDSPSLQGWDPGAAIDPTGLRFIVGW